MEVKQISIKTDLDEIPNIKNVWCDVYVTLDDDRTYYSPTIDISKFFAV